MLCSAVLLANFQALTPGENLRENGTEGNGSYKVNKDLQLLVYSSSCLQFFLACAESFAVQSHFKVLLSYPALIGI
jgi:hypothetical protein